MPCVSTCGVLVSLPLILESHSDRWSDLPGQRALPLSLGWYSFSILLRAGGCVSWSLTSLFSTNMAISETNRRLCTYRDSIPVTGSDISVECYCVHTCIEQFAIVPPTGHQPSTVSETDSPLPLTASLP